MNDDEQVERAARALHDEQPFTPSSWDDCPEAWRRNLIALARLVLHARADHPEGG